MPECLASDRATNVESEKVVSRSAKLYRRIALAASAIVIPLVVLVAIEFCLRLANVGFTTDLLVPCTIKGSPASCYNLFFATPYFPAGMVQTPRLYSVPATKPPGTFRIFVLGESAAMGDPDSAYGFSRYLEVMLRQRYPSVKFEVVNTGSVAINSHVVLQIARGLANQKPDLFIIYSGNNEVVGPYGPGTMLTSVGMSLPVVRSDIFFRSTRIGQLLTKLGTKKREWRGMEMFLDNQVRGDSPGMRHAYSNYERNLRDTIEVAQRAGARVIVATVATNLKDCAPFASLHREGMKKEDLNSWSVFMQKGTGLEAEGNYADALQTYYAAAKIDDEYAELEFRIARCLSNLGDAKSAREHFARARDLDTLRFRADSEINRINRTVAASIAGVKVVDAEQILADASQDGIVGSDLVYEHVHMTPEANYILARAMFSQIAPSLPSPAAADPGVILEADCERLLALTRYDHSRLGAEMFNRLQKPPFTNQINHAEQLFRMAAMAAPSDETPNDTAAQYQWAIAQRADDAMLHLHFGMFLFRYNRIASAQQFAMAQPWDGYPVFLPDGTPVQ
jgi:tetratricopeptide (TPR) repeat protein